MSARTIRIIERCEFGEPGDLIRPEPHDAAALLVEVRKVAVYAQEPEAAVRTSVSEASEPPRDLSKRRRPRG